MIKEANVSGSFGGLEMDCALFACEAQAACLAARGVFVHVLVCLPVLLQLLVPRCLSHSTDALRFRSSANAAAGQEGDDGQVRHRVQQDHLVGA